MFCIFCGKEIVHKSKFCIYCGKQLPVRENQQTHESIETQNENFETEDNHTCEQHTVNSNAQFGLKSKDNTDVKKEQEVAPQPIVPSIPVENPENSVKICKSCGSENPAEMTFCGRCGVNMCKNQTMIQNSYQSITEHEDTGENNSTHTRASNSGYTYEQLSFEELRRREQLRYVGGIENSAYSLKLNPFYPVYVPKTKEEKISVIALDNTSNLKRVLFEKFATTSGRASRGEYWRARLFIFLIDVIIMINVARATTSSHRSDDIAGIALIFLIFPLITIIPLITLEIRRFHDIGKSGKWVFIYFVPYIGILIALYLLCQKGDAHINVYGKPENYYKATPDECIELGLVQMEKE